MKKLLQLLSMLGVNAVPALGWFVEGWSAGSTLLIYWFENVAACLFVSWRIWLHRRWVCSRGHYKQGTGTLLGNFLFVSLAFSAVHGFFLGVAITMLTLKGHGQLVNIELQNVWLGCANVLLFLTINFLVDLPGLRKKPFLWVEQMAERNFARVFVVHLTLIFGMLGVALTHATKAFFGVFVGLKTLNDLSIILPQCDPATPPKWLCWIMDKVPNLQNGKSRETFAEFWVKDKAKEIARRRQNEQPYYPN